MSITENNYSKNTKIYNLFELIKEKEDLNHLLIDDRFDLSHNDYFSKGFTHLHKCVMKTKKYPFLNEYIDEYLKLFPKEIDIISHNGATALILACANFKTSSTKETIEILLKHKANVNFQCHNDKGTALYFAIYYAKENNSKIVKILLKYGADINLQNKSGWTPLSIASCFLNVWCTTKTIEILLKYNPDVNVQDVCGGTVLMYAIEYFKNNDSKCVIKMLLKHNADINLKNILHDNAITIDISKHNIHNVIDILLSSRYEYFKNIPNNEDIIINQKYWKVKNIDYKYMSKCVNNMTDILNFM